MVVCSSRFAPGIIHDNAISSYASNSQVSNGLPPEDILKTDKNGEWVVGAARHSSASCDFMGGLGVVLSLNSLL